MIVKSLSNSFNPVPKNSSKNVKKESKSSSKNVKKESKSSSKNVKIKQKSSKLAKLERQRDKDIVKSGKCDYCHKVKNRLDPHEVYGGSNRQISIKNGFVKMLCRECHSNEKIINQLRKDVQKEYEKNHTREDFIKIIGKSYL